MFFGFPQDNPSTGICQTSLSPLSGLAGRRPFFLDLLQSGALTPSLERIANIPYEIFPPP